jgi:hypothetical protein
VVPVVHAVLWKKPVRHPRENPDGRISMMGSEGVIVARRGLHDEDEGWEERLFDLPEDDDEDDDDLDDDDLDEDVDDLDDEDDEDLDELDEDL